MLEAVKENLKTLCVLGISIFKIQGYGEERNYFHSDWAYEYNVFRYS